MYSHGLKGVRLLAEMLIFYKSSRNTDKMLSCSRMLNELCFQAIGQPQIGSGLWPCITSSLVATICKIVRSLLSKEDWNYCVILGWRKVEWYIFIFLKNNFHIAMVNLWHLSILKSKRKGNKIAVPVLATSFHQIHHNWNYMILDKIVLSS